MKITITDCKYTPSWETLEQVLREATDRLVGQIVRISRKDKGCGYREVGEYEVDFRNEEGTTRIDLSVLGGRYARRKTQA